MLFKTHAEKEPKKMLALTMDNYSGLGLQEKRFFC
jgi:hypothetical protein